MLKELAREVYTQTNGPSAWDKLTEQGKEYYTTRMRQAYDAALAASAKYAALGRACENNGIAGFKEGTMVFRNPGPTVFPASPYTYASFDNSIRTSGWDSYFKGISRSPYKDFSCNTELFLEGYGAARAYSEGKTYLKDSARPFVPQAPWIPGPGRNARIKGWNDYFVGVNKCPFPPSRKDLTEEYNWGWGQASEQNAKGFVSGRTL